MTTTTHDYRSLLASCRHNPADDVERLKLADELDSMDAVWVKCLNGECRNGRECVSSDNYEGNIWNDCRICKGTGFVRDLTRARHAELLRASVELRSGFVGNCKACGLPLGDYCVADGCSCNSPRGVNHGSVPTYVCTCSVCDPQQTGGVRERPPVVDLLLARESELTAALADYRPTCPMCKGVYTSFNVVGPIETCPHCDKGRIGTWQRGLLTLTVPTIETVFHQAYKDCPSCYGTGEIPEHGGGHSTCPQCTGHTRVPGKWTPTVWAIDAVANYPVVQIVAEDRVPDRERNLFGWVSESKVSPRGGDRTSPYPSSKLPTCIFDILWNMQVGAKRTVDRGYREFRVVEYDTRQQAIDALSTAFVLAIAEHKTEER